MPQYGSPSYITQGTIQVASFVKNDPTLPYGVIQCLGPTDRPIGVAQQGPRQPPGVVGSTGVAASGTAAAPQPIQVFGPGDVCRLTISTSQVGNVNPGDLLISDSSGNGYGIVASPGQVAWFGAIALTTGQAGQLIRVLVTGPIPLAPGSSFSSL